jgi:hypothetical protein
VDTLLFLETVRCHPDFSSEFRQAMTKQLDRLFIECARKLNDGNILAVLNGDDVVAQYHYFLSSSTINCINLRSDLEFKLIFTDAVLDFESITQHPDIINIIIFLYF